MLIPSSVVNPRDLFTLAYCLFSGNQCVYTRASSQNYNTIIYLVLKIIIGPPLQFLETKNITGQTSWSQNPGHKSCDPGHSNKTFWLDSL